MSSFHLVKSRLLNYNFPRHPSLEMISIPDATPDFPDGISLLGLVPRLRTSNVSSVHLERVVDMLSRKAVSNLVHNAPNLIGLTVSLQRMDNDPDNDGYNWSCVPRILAELTRLKSLKYFCLDNSDIFPTEGQSAFAFTMRTVAEQTTIEYLRTTEMYLGDMPSDLKSWYRLIRDGRGNYTGYNKMRRCRDAGIETGFDELEFSGFAEYVSVLDLN
ncbi:hypothetical protein M422DRAFT_51628 [Sphaerobolus stellatus SS14]|uniref:Uncharacterized protein n=1 Tax=Sphaerobolus stellatus (strain SS14) TaxID=990650 RepID=A0A0C9UJQ1_SPHS4|nr:hypothetical protein M422DRAFT_51628 [Sphaerobolus stellatus SS14]